MKLLKQFKPWGICHNTNETAKYAADKLAQSKKLPNNWSSYLHLCTYLFLSPAPNIDCFVHKVYLYRNWKYTAQLWKSACWLLWPRADAQAQLQVSQFILCYVDWIGNHTTPHSPAQCSLFLIPSNKLYNYASKPEGCKYFKAPAFWYEAPFSFLESFLIVFDRE